MATRAASLTLSGSDTSADVRRGDLALKKGKAMAGLALDCTWTITNANASPQTITAADKLVILGNLKGTLEYGAQNARRIPFQGLSFATLRRLMRFTFGSEVYGYNDTATGMGRTLNPSGTNGGLTTVKATLVIPTGRLWFLGNKLQNLFAMGRSQVRSIALRVERAGAPTFGNTNLSIAPTSAVTIDVYPVEVSVKGDRTSWIPEYRERIERNFRAEFDDQLPLFISENTAAHASTALTRINVDIDQEPQHRDAAPAQILRELSSTPNFPTAGLITDDVTLLYAAQPDRGLSELQSGKVFVEQPNKDLADFKLGDYYLPVVDERTQKEWLVEAANEWRKKSLKMTSLNVIENLDLPDRLTGFIPSVLTDEDDRESSNYPGLGVPHRGSVSDVKVYVPEHVARAAKSRAAGGGKSAEDALKQVARAIPTTARGGRGISTSAPDTLAIASALRA